VGGDWIGRDSLPDEGVDPGSEQRKVFGRRLAREAGYTRDLTGHPQRLDVLWDLLNELDAELVRPLSKPKRSIAIDDNAREVRLAHRLRKGVALCLRQIAENDWIARSLRRAGSWTSKRPGLDLALVRVSS